jgi:hypothetical protein
MTRCHSYEVLVYVGALYERDVVDTDVSAQPASIFSVELLSENLKSPSGSENADETCRIHYLDKFQYCKKTLQAPRRLRHGSI